MAATAEPWGVRPARLTPGMLGIYAFLVISALFFAIPLYVMVVTSLKTMPEIRLGTIFAPPSDLTTVVILVSKYRNVRKVKIAVRRLATVCVHKGLQFAVNAGPGRWIISAFPALDFVRKRRDSFQRKTAQ